MNRPIRILSLGFLALFLALMVNVTYLQAFKASDYAADPRNRRVIAESFSRERGAILVGREAVADSEAVDGRYKFQRTYPEPFKYAPVTGYFSYYSMSGIELTQNPVLSGDDPRLFVTRLIDLLSSSAHKGGNVQLTLDAGAQTAAYEGLTALGDNAQGAVVAIEPATGRILAMVSTPSFDPNKLASHDLAAVSKTSEQLNADEREPLLNRATQTTLPPGSTFKVVTAAAALEAGLYDSAEEQVPGGPSWQLPQTTGETGLIDNEGRSCGDKTVEFAQAMAQSCNTTFLQLADELGIDRLKEQADAFGFNSDSPLEDLPSVATSRVPGDLDEPQTAMAGIGQSEVAASPLQMAMVMSAVANGGMLMKPYLVDEVTTPSLDSLGPTEDQELSRAMSPDTARELTKMLVATVAEGTGAPAAIDGVEVAGKTGTAQSAEDRPPYLWFTGFAPAEDPQVAVAVLVQSMDGSTSEAGGGSTGGPIAKAVMEAILR